MKHVPTPIACAQVMSAQIDAGLDFVRIDRSLGEVAVDACNSYGALVVALDVERRRSELLETTLKALLAEADGFNVSGVYFSEFAKPQLDAAHAALASVRS